MSLSIINNKEEDFTTVSEIKKGEHYKFHGKLYRRATFPSEKIEMALIEMLLDEMIKNGKEVEESSSYCIAYNEGNAKPIPVPLSSKVSRKSHVKLIY